MLEKNASCCGWNVSASIGPCKKTVCLFEFSYVCPEPVLVKLSLLNTNGAKNPFSLTGYLFRAGRCRYAGPAPAPVPGMNATPYSYTALALAAAGLQNRRLFSTFLCLSRACRLGNHSVLNIKQEMFSHQYTMAWVS